MMNGQLEQQLDENNEIAGESADDSQEETQAPVPRLATRSKRAYTRRKPAAAAHSAAVVPAAHATGSAYARFMSIRASADEVRAAAIREIEAQEQRCSEMRRNLGLDAPSAPSAPRAIAGPATAARSEKRAKRTKLDRLPRRTDDEIAAHVRTVLAVLLGEKKGLRAEQIREKLGVSAKEMPRIMKAGIAAGVLRAEGQKRATTYFSK